MKLAKINILLFTIFILLDGFDGEFTNPTVFDIIKWICYIVMIILFINYQKNTI